VPAFCVLYEDSHLLAIDKPAGLHTAPLQPGEGGTLLGEVIARYPEIASLPGIKPMEPGLLHRLDRETSGVVIVARTAEAFAALRAQFAAKQVCKEYLAVCVSAAVPAGPLRIESRFAPYGPGRKEVRVVLEAGRRNVSSRLYATEAQVLEARGGRALVRAGLLRGFRHQVRAHLAHLGLPILGDPLYGVPCPAGVPARLYLHAARVDLLHPVTGAALSIRSPVPPEFPAALGQACLPGASLPGTGAT
jgi:23S rRNA pseudouridine1911/1915/1917 synthase